MAVIRGREKKGGGEIFTASMADIVFLLIVFFMLTSVFAETKGIKRAFGDHAYKIPVSSTKSMTGHLLGGAGALEALLCVLAIRDGVLPPTINYENPDPLCDLNYIPNEAREADCSIALTNSFGFGGQNISVVASEFKD